MSSPIEKAGPEKPFTIDIPQTKLDILKQKLSLVEFPNELENAGWDYGVPLGDMKRLVERWQNGYDWRKLEGKLNSEMRHFTRDISVDGHGMLNVHYVHQRSARVSAIPVIFAHGWPGSFLMLRKILPLLTNATNETEPAFHVVAPSLPGFGFSTAPERQGFGPPACAETCHKLMVSLGYDKYVVLGGPFAITWTMAAKYGGKNVAAWHTIAPYRRPIRFHDTPLLYIRDMFTPYSKAEKASGARQEYWITRGNGFLAQQSTQPQTLGYSLADSPVGLLAWFYDKLVNWTDSYEWEDDEVLDWVSVYLFSTAGPAASLKIFYETRQDKTMQKINNAKRLNIPMGASFFPHDFTTQRKLTLHGISNIVVFSKFHQHGGRFPAYEKPQELVDDIRAMFRKGGKGLAGLPKGAGFN